MKRFVLVLVAALAACGKSPPAGDDAQQAPIVPGAPLAPDAAPDAGTAPAPAARPAVRYDNGKLVEDHSPPVIEINSEFENYKHGTLDVPAYPGDVVYLYADLKTEAGTPLKNVAVQVDSKLGNSRVLMADRTDENGELAFRLIAERLGEDVITVSAAGIHRDFFMNVTAPTRGEWLSGLDLKGTTSWDLLLSARLDMKPDSVSATFPPPLQALDRKTVRIAGFMLPLGISEKQTHFLFSANPPSCFFHPPGGPATAMEVFADGSVPMSYDPMVLEGRLELSGSDPDFIVYRLKAARLVSMIKS
ncbi:MAG: DUF3299 domain-containing protein [Solimonas sp.]